MTIALPTIAPHSDTPITPAMHAPLSAQPLVEHKVSAGFPSPAADYVEKGLDLNVFLVEHKEATFFFQVVGDSMKNIGIMDGDIVVVDRSVSPSNGHVVLAVIDGEYTLKTLRTPRFGVFELHPENPAYKPIRLVEGQELQVWGVVTGSVRKLRV